MTILTVSAAAKSGILKESDVNRGGFRLHASLLARWVRVSASKTAFLFFFYLLPRVAWNPRYSSFLLLRRTPVDPSALKMYQSRVAAVFCRNSLAWNLKGVVKNNACWDLRWRASRRSHLSKSTCFSGIGKCWVSSVELCRDIPKNKK